VERDSPSYEEVPLESGEAYRYWRVQAPAYKGGGGKFTGVRRKKRKNSFRDKGGNNEGATRQGKGGVLMSITEETFATEKRKIDEILRPLRNYLFRDEGKEMRSVDDGKKGRGKEQMN